MAYIERKMKTIVWDAEGLKAAGRLVRLERVKFKDGGHNFRYMLKNAEGSVVVFMGATNLNAMLHADDMGCNMHVEYLGEDTTREMSEGRSRPKLFKVLVDAESKAEVPAGAFAATDEDIPF